MATSEQRFGEGIATAPSFALIDARGRSLRSEDVAGMPLVVAFLPHQAGAELRGDRSLAGHLRGAGTALLVIARDEVLLLRADDAARRVPAPEARVALAQAYGVDGAEAFFVVDESGLVRFAWNLADLGVRLAGPAALTTALGRALRAAGDALRAARIEPQARSTTTTAPATAESGMSRRDALTLALATGFGAALLEACKPHERVTANAVNDGDAAAATTSAVVDRVVPEVDVTLTVNGASRPLKIEPRVSLLDALRERLGLTGTKKGCDHGQCGACTVHVDGRSVNACLTLAIACEGSQVTTIEGLASGDTLHPMQEAFVEHDAYQCGYCTPGQIMSAVWLTRTKRAKTDDEVREMMSGNICRCGAYANIVAAVQAVNGKQV